MSQEDFDFAAMDDEGSASTTEQGMDGDNMEPVVVVAQPSPVSSPPAVLSAPVADSSAQTAFKAKQAKAVQARFASSFLPSSSCLLLFSPLLSSR